MKKLYVLSLISLFSPLIYSMDLFQNFSRLAPDANDDINLKILKTAIRKKKPQALQKILSKYNIDINKQYPPYSYTLAHYAIEARTDTTAILTVLATHKADFTRKDNKGNTPLHSAAVEDRANMVNFLITQAPQAVTMKNITQDRPVDCILDGLFNEKTIAVFLSHDNVPQSIKDELSLKHSVSRNDIVNLKAKLHKKNAPKLTHSVLTLALENNSFNTLRTLAKHSQQPLPKSWEFWAAKKNTPGLDKKSLFEISAINAIMNQSQEPITRDCLICLCSFKANQPISKLNCCVTPMHSACLTKWFYVKRNKTKLNCPSCGTIKRDAYGASLQDTQPIQKPKNSFKLPLPKPDFSCFDKQICAFCKNKGVSAASQTQPSNKNIPAITECRCDLLNGKSSTSSSFKACVVCGQPCIDQIKLTCCQKAAHEHCYLNIAPFFKEIKKGANTILLCPACSTRQKRTRK